MARRAPAILPLDDDRTTLHDCTTHTFPFLSVTRIIPTRRIPAPPRCIALIAPRFPFTSTTQVAFVIFNYRHDRYLALQVPGTPRPRFLKVLVRRPRRKSRSYCAPPRNPPRRAPQDLSLLSASLTACCSSTDSARRDDGPSVAVRIFSILIHNKHTSPASSLYHYLSLIRCPSPYRIVSPLC